MLQVCKKKSFKSTLKKIVKFSSHKLSFAKEKTWMF